MLDGRKVRSYAVTPSFCIWRLLGVIIKWHILHYLVLNEEVKTPCGSQWAHFHCLQKCPESKIFFVFSQYIVQTPLFHCEASYLILHYKIKYCSPLSSKGGLENQCWIIYLFQILRLDKWDNLLDSHLLFTNWSLFLSKLKFVTSPNSIWNVVKPPWHCGMSPKCVLRVASTKMFLEPKD